MSTLVRRPPRPLARIHRHPTLGLQVEAASNVLGQEDSLRINGIFMLGCRERLCFEEPAGASWSVPTTQWKTFVRKVSMEAPNESRVSAVLISVSYV